MLDIIDLSLKIKVSNFPFTLIKYFPYCFPKTTE